MTEIFPFFILEYAHTQFAYSPTSGLKGKPDDSTYNGTRINAITLKASNNDILKVYIKNITAQVKGKKAMVMHICEILK
jgi:hypothetical protein